MKISIRKKLIFQIIFILLIALITTTGLNSYYSRMVLENNHINQYLPHSLKLVANQIENYLSVPMNASQLLAGNSYLRNAIYSGEKPEDIQQLIVHLKESVNMMNTQTIFYVSDRSKKYYTYTGVLKIIQDDGNNFDKWFFNFKASNREIELNKDYDEATHEHFLFINCAIRGKNGEFLGSAGYGVHLNQLKQFVNMVSIGKKGFVYLVDRKGNIQFHRDAKLEQKNIADIDGMNKLQKQILSSNVTNGLIFHSNEKGEHYISSRYLPLLDWFIIAEIPIEDVFGELNGYISNIVIFNILLFILSLFLISFIIKRITRPISEIHDSIKVFLKQQVWDLNWRISVQSNDEIGDIAQAFNQVLIRFHEMLLQLHASKIKFDKQLKDLSTMSNRILMISQNQEESTKVTSASIEKMTHNIKSLFDYTMMLNAIHQYKSKSYAHQLEVINEFKDVIATFTLSLNPLISLVSEFKMQDDHYSLEQDHIDKILKMKFLVEKLQESLDAHQNFQTNLLKEENLSENFALQSFLHQQSLDSLNIEAHQALKELANINQIQQFQSDAIHEISMNLDLVVNMFAINQKLIQDTSESSEALGELIHYFNEYLMQFKLNSESQKAENHSIKKS